MWKTTEVVSYKKYISDRLSNIPSPTYAEPSGCDMALSYTVSPPIPRRKRRNISPLLHIPATQIPIHSETWTTGCLILFLHNNNPTQHTCLTVSRSFLVYRNILWYAFSFARHRCGTEYVELALQPPGTLQHPVTLQHVPGKRPAAVLSSG